MGTTTELRKLFHFLLSATPAHILFLNLSKTTACWPAPGPSTTPLQASRLLASGTYAINLISPSWALQGDLGPTANT